MMPPIQLQDPTYRFCKVVRNGKNAFEKKFNTPDKAYSYNDSECFGRWMLSEGGNYGVLAGYGRLFVLDFDDRDTFMKCKQLLPPTMMVISAGKKLPHLYYKAYDVCSDEEIRTVLFDNSTRERIIDLQGFGKYVVGPGSKIGDNEYSLRGSRGITSVSYHQVVELLRNMFPNIHVAKTKTMPVAVRFKPQRENDEVWKIKQQVSMTSLLNHYGCNTSMYRCQCPAGHHSNSGKDVAHDNNLMYCFNCMLGGDIFSVVMGVEKIEFVESIAWLKDTFNIH